MRVPSPPAVSVCHGPYVVENGDNGVLPAASRQLVAMRRCTEVSEFLNPVCDAHPSGDACAAAAASNRSATIEVNFLSIVIIVLLLNRNRSSLGRPVFSVQLDKASGVRKVTFESEIQSRLSGTPSRRSAVS